MSHELPIVDYALSAITDDAQRESSIRIQMSRGWIGAGVAVTYRAPDFTTFPGWDASMALKPRAAVQWRVSRDEVSTREFVVGRRFQNTEYSGMVGSYCGNGTVEPAYEQCDPPNGTTCSATCQTQAAPTGAQWYAPAPQLRRDDCGANSYQEPCL
jgi:cysteine-rich repeat protein